MRERSPSRDTRCIFMYSFRMYGLCIGSDTGFRIGFGFGLKWPNHSVSNEPGNTIVSALLVLPLEVFLSNLLE